MSWQFLSYITSNPLSGSLFRTIFLGWISYIVFLYIYRLYFSPLARFPGPKLAAISAWYEAYYEIVLQGRYSFKIAKLHDVYGPIIRVTPDELHIRDSDFFDSVYTGNTKIDKPGWDAKFGVIDATFTTPDGALHRKRRAALNPFFSRRSIQNFEPTVREYVDLLCQRLSEFAGNSQPMVISDVYPAFTGDIIMNYAFGFCYNQLQSPNFDSFHEAYLALGLPGHINGQFPWFGALVNSIPDRYVEKIQPATASLLRLKRDLWDLVGDTIRTENQPSSDKLTSTPTIFHGVLHSDLSPSDKQQARLTDEAVIVVGAGIETTGYALTVGTFHIANTPHIYDRLHGELVTAFPDPNTIPNLLDLEKLPYLKACIQESLRLSYGLSARNPRRHARDLRYKGWTIPAHTTVSMTVSNVHHDEEIFPDSHAFVPERWLGDPRTGDGTPLERYLVAFGRGPRICLGMNLAWAELFFAMGMIFRRFELKLYETDVTDVKYKHDFFTPRVKSGSKGVRVIVSENLS
ncbi:hypothetical protein FQN54_005395 [Arachnomyces sp. PD_36]|nr:hypothetical protein FQN54_005395 [Arachnomyces sp. PD_36]